jgi:hypothetical protein
LSSSLAQSLVEFGMEMVTRPLRAQSTVLHHEFAEQPLVAHSLELLAQLVDSVAQLVQLLVQLVDSQAQLAGSVVAHGFQEPLQRSMALQSQLPWMQPRQHRLPLVMS